MCSVLQSRSGGHSDAEAQPRRHWHELRILNPGAESMVGVNRILSKNPAICHYASKLKSVPHSHAFFDRVNKFPD